MSIHIVENTLARLYCRVSPGRMAEVEIAYEELVVPVLARYELVEVEFDGRSTPENIFSRIFSFSNPSEYQEKVRSLYKDTAWQAAWREVNGVYGGGSGLQHGTYGFWPISSPGGTARKITVGEGRGHWQVFSVVDGLAGSYVRAIYQE